MFSVAMWHQVSRSAQEFVPADMRTCAEDTAWFVPMTNRWFDLMNSRHPGMALSKSQVEKYDEAVVFLNSVIDVVSDLAICKG